MGSGRGTETLPSVPTECAAHPQRPTRAAPDFWRIPEALNPPLLSQLVESGESFPVLLSYVLDEWGPGSHSRPRLPNTSSSGASPTACGGLPHLPRPSLSIPGPLRPNSEPTPPPATFPSLEPFSGRLLERAVFTLQPPLAAHPPPSDPPASSSPAPNSPCPCGPALPLLGKAPPQIPLCPPGRPSLPPGAGSGLISSLRMFLLRFVFQLSPIPSPRPPHLPPAATTHSPEPHEPHALCSV